MKENIHHLGQEKQKKSNFLQLKNYKISGGTIGKIDPAYGLNSKGLTPQQVFNARKAAEAEAAKITQTAAAQNEKIVAAVETVLNNTQVANAVVNLANEVAENIALKKPNNIQVANAVVKLANVVAANVVLNKPSTNNKNNKQKYINLLTKIRDGITNILPKE
jgi:D-aminopeptidase